MFCSKLSQISDHIVHCLGYTCIIAHPPWVHGMGLKEWKTVARFPKCNWCGYCMILRIVSGYCSLSTLWLIQKANVWFPKCVCFETIFFFFFLNWFSSFLCVINYENIVWLLLCTLLRGCYLILRFLLNEVAVKFPDNE